MYKIYNTYCIFFLCFSIAFVSCQKVINLDIDSVNKKYVIEAQITDNANSARVNLSQTFDISDSNKFTGVEGATVSIAEDNKAPVKLSSVGSGIYRINMSGKPGHTYKLVVEVNGHTFTSTSAMPAKVKIDTLYVTERFFLRGIKKIATVEFTDPPEIGNAYRMVQYVNKRKENTIFTFNDYLINGRKVIYELLIFGDQNYTLKKDDQVEVSMLCINMPVYEFWYSLAQGALGQSQSASPGNPVTNINGGAIGYFSAHTFDSKTMVVK